jgi:hypothetical protein
MIKVQLTVSKRRRDIIKIIELPETWQEYSGQGFDTMSAIRLLLTLSPTVAKVQILRGILQKQGIPNTLFLAMSDDNIADLVVPLAWMQPDASPIPLFPDFIHKGITYILPTERFENGSALEFALADDFFKKAVEQDDKERQAYLLKLVATLCREEKSDTDAIIASGDRRQVLHSRAEVEHRATKLNALDEAIQVAIFLYFAGVKKYIFDLYGKYIFTIPDEDESDETNTEETPAANAQAESFGWWGIFMELAQNLIHLDQIHQRNFHELCLWLVRSKMQQDRMRSLITPPTFKDNED